MPEKSCKSNNPVIVFGYFLLVVCWVETRLIASLHNLFGILRNRRDKALPCLLFMMLTTTQNYPKTINAHFWSAFISNISQIVFQ